MSWLVVSTCGTDRAVPIWARKVLGERHVQIYLEIFAETRQTDDPNCRSTNKNDGIRTPFLGFLLNRGYVPAHWLVFAVVTHIFDEGASILRVFGGPEKGEQ